MTWSVPRLWEGRTVAILASGESMSQAVADSVRAAGLPAIAVNNTFRLAPWADMLYAADGQWWIENRDAFAFKGLKASVTRISGVQFLRNTGTVGFESEPSGIRTGGNSGYQAVHIAVHAGAKRILLCGFDMHGGHWHPDHPHPLRKTPQEARARWVERFHELGEAMTKLGVEVINCTPGSLLNCFPMMSLEAALEACRVPAA